MRFRKPVSYTHLIAYDMRCAIGIAINPVNDTYRLVHGEGDNLPGLDVYKRQELYLLRVDQDKLQFSRMFLI